MTKPGNSDPDEPKRDDVEPTPTAHEPTAEPVAAETDSGARPASDDVEPLMTELEKAPPPPEEPVMPTAREAAARRAQAGRNFDEAAPKTLKWAFYLFVASGVVWVFGSIAALVIKQSLIDEQVKRNTNKDVTAEQISTAVNQVLWLALVLSITFAVFMALFGYKATEGTRRARTLVTIFGTIVVLFHLLLNGTLIGLLSAFLGLAALALLYSPTARAYFPPREKVERRKPGERR